MQEKEIMVKNSAISSFAAGIEIQHDSVQFGTLAADIAATTTRFPVDSDESYLDRPTKGFSFSSDSEAIEDIRKGKRKELRRLQAYLRWPIDFARRRKKMSMMSSLEWIGVKFDFARRHIRKCRFGGKLDKEEASGDDTVTEDSNGDSGKAYEIAKWLARRILTSISTLLR
ncbi:hypothetical protein ACH5RR_032024 [Cinchona calisaya]|uniref:Uncharacterized protein n=1 Tax=Cinchona calisaya TaxID=153742 RepID=A0ABD2YLB7_9GENT